MKSLHTEKCWAGKGAQSGPCRVSRRLNCYCCNDLSSLGCSFFIIRFLLIPFFSVYLNVAVFRALPAKQHTVHYFRTELVPLWGPGDVGNKIVFSTLTQKVYVHEVTSKHLFVNIMNTWFYFNESQRDDFNSSSDFYFISSKVRKHFCTHQLTFSDHGIQSEKYMDSNYLSRKDKRGLKKQKEKAKNASPANGSELAHNY